MPFADAACAGLPLEWWFDEDQYHLGRPVCAVCPALEPCLIGSIERNEEYGLWAGAGETTRRGMRRLYLAGDPDLGDAIVRHIGRLDGNETSVEDVNSVAATHGLLSTYNRGCRCPPCRDSTGRLDAVSLAAQADPMRIAGPDLRCAPVPVDVQARRVVEDAELAHRDQDFAA